MSVIALATIVGATLLARLRALDTRRSIAHVRAVEAVARVGNHFDDIDGSMRSMRGLFAASERVDPEKWSAFVKEASRHLESDWSLGFAFIAHLPIEQRDEFVRHMRGDGFPDYAIRGSSDVEPAMDSIAPVKYFEPLESNRHILGVDAFSNPLARERLLLAARTNKPIVTDRIKLRRIEHEGWSVVVYLPVYAVDPTDLDEHSRVDTAIGWIAAPIVIERFLAHALSTDASLVGSRLESIDDEHVELGAWQSESKSPDSVWSESIPLTFAGRRLQLTIDVPSASMASVAAEVAPVTLLATLFGAGIVALTMFLAGTKERVVRLADRITGQLRESEQRFSIAVKGSQDGLWDWNLETNTVYYAPRWKELMGCEGEEISDSPSEWLSRISPECIQSFQDAIERHVQGQTNRFDMAVHVVHPGGERRWMLCRAAAVRDAGGKAIRLAGSVADITDLKNAQDALRHASLHDKLTNLPNRELFSERLSAAITTAGNDPNCRFAVLFFDFDRFKVINDSLGHDVGDALLISIADRFRAEIAPCDTAARFGGDEFVLLLEEIDGLENATARCEALLRVFALPHEIDGHEVVSTASIGLVTGDAGYQSTDDIIRDADAAMYEAKCRGKARYHVFDAGMHEMILDRLRLENDLRRANLDEEGVVLYQPIICLRTARLAGFEALVRWRHPRLGLLSPDKFIDMAEETGLILPLGDWVMQTACRQLRQWQSQSGNPDLFMNVNLSKRQLMEASLPDLYGRMIQDAGVSPSTVKLEITESTIMEDHYDVAEILRAIKSKGIRLAMDDFGTGHSSLSCLHQFPIDVLKIDRSFVSNMEGSRQFAAVLDAIITLAQHLDMDVVAEGIENRVQLAQLQAMDCGYAQGYFFAQPLPAEQAATFLSRDIRVTDAA